MDHNAHLHLYISDGVRYDVIQYFDVIAHFLFLGNIRLKAAESDCFIPWFYSLTADVFFFIVCETMFTILIRVKAAAWQFNKLDNCVLPCKAVKLPRTFIRPCKQIRRLLASLLYNGQASFPTLLPFSGAGKFSLSALPMPYATFFTHNLSMQM